MGGGIGMGNTCKPMAVSFQCMTKFTTNKKKKKKKRVNGPRVQMWDKQSDQVTFSFLSSWGYESMCLECVCCVSLQRSRVCLGISLESLDF